MDRCFAQISEKGNKIIHLVCLRKIFRKTYISYLPIRTRTSVYQGVRNVRFWENFAYVLNDWSLRWFSPVSIHQETQKQLKRHKTFIKKLKTVSGIDFDIAVFLCHCKSNVFNGVPVKCVLLITREGIGVLMDICLRITWPLIFCSLSFVIVNFS